MIPRAKASTPKILTPTFLPLFAEKLSSEIDLEKLGKPPGTLQIKLITSTAIRISNRKLILKETPTGITSNYSLAT
ncbi:hypothetical protein CEXT_613191 [Caerostris extrusa]|uniref:Uncharacterized protein n=1 Tax=Caerostris extrusa TaxID=172846 RepID=A0AAV4RSS2_CAEEX|nr:hypothetical protein CEXT_613191 [Caerostris extrusa]